MAQIEVAIRPLTAFDSIEDLTKMLHRAYEPLAAAGFHYFATHQPPEVTAERCAAGETYVAEVEGKVVGCITLRKPALDLASLTKFTKAGTEPTRWYLRDDVWVFGQYAVEPELQGTGIGIELLKHVEERAKELGAKKIACDTAEGARNLIEFYTKRGYRLVGKASWEGVNYESVILSKSLPL